MNISTGPDYLILGVISNDTSLAVGETALLICAGYGQPDVEITWSRNNEDIANASLVTIYEEEVSHGVRSFKQSFLEVCSVDITDDGSYNCIARVGQATTTANTQLSVSGEKCIHEVKA